MIHVSEPVLSGNERRYVNEALDACQLSMGPFVQRFEAALAAYVGTRHAIACSSGTAALHLALLALGVGPGDEVIVPALTFVATANAVRYCGARPVIVDVDPETWCINWRAAGQFWIRSLRVRVVLPVHLFGVPAWTQPVKTKSPGLIHIIEDAAEAIGASWGNRKMGAWADLGCFSFYGNKLITCGEGGAVTTDDDELAAKVRLLRGQGQGERRYWHELVGYNYRMTDLQAAIGLAQLENIEWHLARRAEVAYWYRRYLPGCITTQQVAPWAKSAHWMNAVLLPDGHTPEQVAQKLAAKGIETRPIFTPLHLLPMYRDGIGRPVAEDIAARGICLPTHANLSEQDVQTICSALAEVIGA